jgi:hypothetical protein
LGSNMYWRPDERWSFYLSLEIWDGLCEQFHCQKILKKTTLVNSPILASIKM